jgi:Uma2 family endonuclease
MNHLHKVAWISEEEYLEGEELAKIRHEYINGQIYAMAGTNARHNLISLNIAFHLRSATKKDHCQVFVNDVKLRISEQKIFYYPDVMLCCDTEDNHELYREKPCLIVEVLSPSTETIDRREKCLTYQRIKSLRYYLLVSSNQKKVEYYQRDDEQNWHVGILESEEILNIKCANKTIALCLEDFYEDVPMP